jgi:S1-C subfamily serine protease
VKKRFAFHAVLLIAALLALSSCGLPALPAVEAQSQAAPTAAPAAAPVVAPSGDSAGAVAALEGTLESIYTRVNPSVVNVQVGQAAEAGSPAIPDVPGSPFQFPAPQGPQPQQGLGSGFVWDTEGHIVTNNHVVDGADRIRVTLYDGTTVPATLVGADPDSDLAVVQVDLPADQLQPVQVADSTQVKVGELVVAIGNPFGLEGTMTLGIVSALGRSLPTESAIAQGPTYTIPDVIQTDAPINPGNSGGVLVDDQGWVIGVTAAIESPVRANAGIGFAIPSAIVQKVVPVLIQDGRYDHPYIGISGTSLTPELAGAMDLESGQRGVLVVDLTAGSPAEEAGLRGSDRQVDVEGQQVSVGGDVIVAIDGETVKEFDDLVTYLARHTKVGQTITLTILRDGNEQTVDLTLAARPTSETVQAPPQRQATGGAYLGIVGLTVTPAIVEEMNLSMDPQGVLVQEVQQDSAADEAGLRGSDRSVTLDGQEILVGGDIIVALDGQPVTSLENLRAALQQYEPGQRATLTLFRDSNEIQVDVTLGELPTTRP